MCIEKANTAKFWLGNRTAWSQICPQRQGWPVTFDSSSSPISEWKNLTQLKWYLQMTSPEDEK
jgi:hypothetical protein